jgi:hypothetical protein
VLVEASEDAHPGLVELEVKHVQILLAMLAPGRTAR